MENRSSSIKGTKKLRPRHYIEYGAMRCLNAFFHALGVDRASAFSGWLLRRLGPMSKYDGFARDNLKRCLPELNENETDRIVRDMWDNFGRTVGEFLLLEQLIDYGPGGRIQVENVEILDRIIAEGKPAIFFAAHLANWELAPPLVIERGGRISGIYRAANNPLVDEWIVDTRQDLTFNTLLPKGRLGAAGAVASIRRGDHLGMLLDQKLNEGIDVPFFGHNAKTAEVAGLFAVKYGCQLVPTQTRRTDGAHFVLTLHEPFTAEITGNQADDIFAVAKKCNDYMEQWIRENPGQWLWMHNRWTSPFRKRYLKRPNYKAAPTP